jgi:hypothetical protein
MDLTMDALAIFTHLSRLYRTYEIALVVGVQTIGTR